MKNVRPIHGMSPSRDYRPNSRKVAQLALSGFVAAFVMFLVGFSFERVGLGSVDWPAVYGAVFNGGFYPVALSGLWWAGLGWHLLVGTVIFPLLFDFLTDKRILPQARYVRGLAFGTSLWFVAEGIVRPLAGDGVFSSDLAFTAGRTLVTGLVTWWVYGIVLEEFTRQPVAKSLGMETHDQQAA